LKEGLNIVTALAVELKVLTYHSITNIKVFKKILEVGYHKITSHVQNIQQRAHKINIKNTDTNQT